MALRDTSWIWDTATSTIKDSHAVEYAHEREILEQWWVITYHSFRPRRTKEIVTKSKKWIGLTKAAKTAFMDNHLSDTNSGTNLFTCVQTDPYLDAWDIHKKDVIEDSQWAYDGITYKDALSDIWDTTTSSTKDSLADTVTSFGTLWYYVKDSVADSFMAARAADTSDTNAYERIDVRTALGYEYAWSNILKRA